MASGKNAAAYSGRSAQANRARHFPVLPVQPDWLLSRLLGPHGIRLPTLCLYTTAGERENQASFRRESSCAASPHPRSIPPVAPGIPRQPRKLKAAGAEQIFVEYEHGDAKVKSQQQAMFAEAQAGDSIIVLEVSRLARSTQQLCEIIDLVREKHLRLVIVGSITLDCRNGQADPMSEAFLQMAGVFSQLELAMIRARVRSGMENARAKGRQIGRPQVSKEDIPATFLRHYPAYKSKQLNVSELARVCDISRTTAYKYIGLLEA